MAPDDVPLVRWEDFAPRFRWNQGEHLALVGPTGQGKTHLALKLLPMRGHTVILGTKPRDKTLAGLKGEGYRRIEQWPPPNSDANRVLLWPKWKGPMDTRRQAEVLRHALLNIFHEESWCVFADDVQYLTDMLGLRRMLDMLWLQARALGISVVAATQRPRNVPRAMWNQSSHLFIWGTNDEEDLKSLGGLGGFSSKKVRGIVAELPKHHALYLNTRDRRMAVTKAER